MLGRSWDINRCRHARRLPLQWDGTGHGHNQRRHFFLLLLSLFLLLLLSFLVLLSSVSSST